MSRRDIEGADMWLSCCFGLGMAEVVMGTVNRYRRRCTANRSHYPERAGRSRSGHGSWKFHVGSATPRCWRNGCKLARTPGASREDGSVRNLAPPLNRLFMSLILYWSFSMPHILPTVGLGLALFQNALCQGAPGQSAPAQTPSPLRL